MATESVFLQSVPCRGQRPHGETFLQGRRCGLRARLRSASRRPGEHPEASLRARRCHALAWCDIEASRPPTDIRNLYVWHRGQFLATRPPRLYDRHGFDLAPRAGFLSGFPAEKAASGRCPSTVRASVASWLRMFVGTPELGHHAASGRTPHSAQRRPLSTSVQWR